MLDILLFIFLGLLVGVGFGLIPGLHPNMIILLVPVLTQLNIPVPHLIAFIVSIGISNTFVDFIPSMLLGAADDGKELSVLPSHRMLLQGSGYDAIKLAVIGGLGSITIITALLPVIIFAAPPVYNFIRPVTYAILIFIAGFMILSERGTKLRIISFSCFALSGIIGLTSQQLPIERTFILFPILSGLFGVSLLLFSSNKKIKIPKMRKEIHVSGRLQRRAIIFGSFGGISSGMLPGVGSSEIASLASVDKNEKSFLMTIGAITISNTLLSILSLWLIEKSRSGIAVVLGQLTIIGFNEFIFIVGVALFVSGLSAIITLVAAKRVLGVMEKINYAVISKAIIILIIIMTALFTGIYGLLLLAICTALGIFANLCRVRRGVLMGILILPTIIFYLPF